MDPQRVILAKGYIIQSTVIKVVRYLMFTTYLFLILKLKLALKIKELAFSGNEGWWTPGLFILLVLLPFLPLKIFFDWALQYHLPKKYHLTKVKPVKYILKLILSTITLGFMLMAIATLLFFSLNFKDYSFIPSFLLPLIPPLFTGLAIFIGSLVIPLFIPIFLKLKKLDEKSLKKIGKILDKYNFPRWQAQVQKNTERTSILKAFFTGWGPFKRIVFSENLIENSTPEELEVVAAHEVGHYKYGHTIKSAFLALIAVASYQYVLTPFLKRYSPVMGASAYPDLISLPLLLLLVLIANIAGAPLLLSIMREWELNVDRFAIKSTRNPRAFISIMEKFVEFNLRDPKPVYIIKFFFYTHPPIFDRIELAKKFKK